MILENLATGKRLQGSLGCPRTPSGCTRTSCQAALMNQDVEITAETDLNKDELLSEAIDFLELFYAETNQEGVGKRISQVKEEIYATGTYEHTYQELEYGVKLCWRNASRCIFRIQWRNIQVIDERECHDAQDMIKACFRHLKEATHGGAIQSVMTVFPQRSWGQRGARIWNPQLIRYAGYKRSELALYGLEVSPQDKLDMFHQHSTDIIGDPSHVDFTLKCLEMGWRPEKGLVTYFDVLPLVCEDDKSNVAWSCIPPELALQVPIVHDDYPLLSEFGIKWHAVPAISSIPMSIGGISYTACPFNGWYMSAEIGSRNLGDVQRYNLLELIAHVMGSLDCSNKRSLWLDRAMVELNKAVITSFDKASVSIVDHHTASDSFINFMDREVKQRGYCTGDWVWLTPPISGSTTRVFHQEMVKMSLKPMFLSFSEPSWKTGNVQRAQPWDSQSNALASLAKNNTETTRAQECNDQSKALPSLTKNQTETAITENSLSRVTSTTTITSFESDVTIIVGTETGMALMYAEKCAKEIQILSKWTVSVILCEDLTQDLNEFLERQSIVLFFVSTCGKGDYPQSLRGHISRISSTFNHLEFAVFGLCSSAYRSSFNEAANRLAHVLNQHGAKQLCSVGKGDEVGPREEIFKEWMHELVVALGLTSSEKDDSYHHGTSEKILVGTVVSVKQLFCRKKGGTWLISLNVPGISYQPGDHLAIYPENSLQDGLMVLNMFGSTDVSLLPEIVQTMALNESPTIEMIQLFEQQAKSIHYETGWSIKKFFQHNIKSLSTVSIQQILFMTPKITPRFYSIASFCNNRVDLVVSEHVWKTGSKTRFGFASSYLSRGVKENSQVRVSYNECRRFHFNVNHVQCKIILMVANGTGIASFRSMIQSLRKTMDQTFKIYLFFGCRNANEILFKEEMVAALKNGIVEEYHVALSRKQTKTRFSFCTNTVNHSIRYHSKMYVQHAVYNWIQDFQKVDELFANGIVYACGSKDMGTSLASLLNGYAKKHLNKDDWVQAAKRNKRFLEDTY